MQRSYAKVLGARGGNLSSLDLTLVYYFMIAYFINVNPNPNPNPLIYIARTTITKIFSGALQNNKQTITINKHLQNETRMPSILPGQRDRQTKQKGRNKLKLIEKMGF